MITATMSRRLRTTNCPFASFVLVILLSFLPACVQEKVFTQPNSAMEPTVLNGEKFAVDVKAYKKAAPGRSDVVVFHHGDILLLKRVIAVPGDTIEGRDFQVVLNGAPLREDYAQHTAKNSVPISPSSSFLKTFGPTKVLPDHFFVMGDNRDFSDDSRDPTFGTVSSTDVVGKAVRIVKSKDAKREGMALH
jgi:signal peptidase I